MQGIRVVGDTVTTAGGHVATKVDFIYTAISGYYRNSVTPASFDLIYVDPATHLIYLGLKTAGKPGTTAATRPDQIDFRNAWTPN
jgi:hypothetical protein